MQITGKADYPADLTERWKRQIPFATMKALNDTAFDARAEIQRDLPQKFRLKNSWTQRHILVEKASKATLEAAVTAPDYMRKQEEGGVVKPQGNHLATPEHLRGKRISVSNRPRAVRNKPNVFLLKRGKGESIVQKVGRKKLRVLFWMTADQKFKPRFGMEQTVEYVVRTRFALHFDTAFQHAIDTAR